MQRYEFSDGKSNKFWQIEQMGAELHIAWGKIGTAGQSQVKAFDDEAKAAVAKAKLIAEKTGKGYVAEGGAASPAPAPSAAAPAPVTPAADAASTATSTAETAAPAKPKVRKAAVKVAAKAGAEGDADDTQSDTASEADVNSVQAQSVEAGEASVSPATAATAASPSPAATPADVDEPPAATTPTEAIQAWLAQRRAQPGVDRQALAAWRQLLALAEAEPELWQASSLSPWQKRFGVDAKAAALMMEWRGNWQGDASPATDWLADPAWGNLDAALQTANELAWAPLLAGEPSKAAEPQDPVPLNGQRPSEAPPAGSGARFGQVLPTVLASPTPAPVLGDTAQAAWDALVALWQPQALPKLEESEVAFAEVIAQTQQRLAAPGQVDAVGALVQADCFESNRLLLAVALCLGDGVLSFKHFNANLRKEENKRLNMRALASQLWHWLRLSHSLPERQALLMAALGLEVEVAHRVGRPLIVAARHFVSLNPENLVLDFLRQDLATASEAERTACLSQLQAADLIPDAWPVMAWVWREQADLSAWVMDRLKTRTSRCNSWHWLMPLARDPGVHEALVAEGVSCAFRSHYHWPALAVAQQQVHGASAIALLAAEMGQHNPPSHELARINHPDALLALMRHSDKSKDINGHLQLAMARWPLAALAAAAQLAQQAQGSGKHAALGLGLVRQLLPEVGPALALLQPWLSSTVWRWLQQLVSSEQDLPMATDQALAEHVPVLVNPPWLKKRKAAAGAALKLVPLAVADALNDWSAKEKTELLANLRHLLKHGISAEKIARDLYLEGNWQIKHAAVLTDWVRFIQAGDTEGLIQSWQAELARVRQQRGQDWQPHLWGTDMAELPPEMGVPFWNQLSTAVYVYQPEAVLAHWGPQAMPGMLALAQQRPALVAEFGERLGSVQLAPWAARHAFASKQPAMRALGRRWLRAWPEHAAAGLIAPALSGTGAEQSTAAQALRWLRGLPETAQGELLHIVAARYGDAAVPAALQAVLDQDPLEQFPAKFAKAMPEFWQPQAWSKPQLNAGGALPEAAVLALGQMLSFGRPDGVYAGLAQVQAACTPASLGAFAWDLFSAWLAAGAPAKDNWAYTALGVLGDEVCVQRLRPLMASWPNEGASARASLGLQILTELGTESALRIVADVAERDKPKGLQAKAQETLTEVAAGRGLSLEDLQDRLVPTMGLDERAQTTLDYGPRQFLLALDENLKPFLRKLENGKPGACLKAVASKNAADDPALATAAIERFKAIKAQADGVAKVQLRRFEQAMVSGRRWTRADFELLYVRQPLMRQLASRLVWGVFEQFGGDEAPAVRAANIRQQPERLHQLLRLSDDSGLTTADDEGWDWPEDALGLDEAAADADGDDAKETAARWRIGIAHPLEMDEQSLANFGQLLADYELMQPFEQLGRPGARLPEAGVDLQAQRSAQIADFMARKDGYSPRRLLGLKSRGWSLSTDNGYEWDGGTRELGDGATVALQLSPGVSLYELKTAPPQTLTWLRVAKGQGEVSWGELDAISYSELVRDLNYLLL